MKALICSLVSTAAFISVPQIACAQFAFGGDAPIEVDADRIEYEGATAIMTGQVQVVQADVRILADKMVLYRATLPSGKYGDVVKIDASGNFYYITPEEKVTGQRGVYEKDADRITITGDVVLEDSEGNLAAGNSLVYNLTRKEALLNGECKGRGCAAGSRASAIFTSTGTQ